MATKKQDDLKDVKEELKEYMKEEIDKEVSNSIKNAEKKLIRHKNLVIIRKNIVIIILLLLIAFGVYYLYKDNYFDKFIKTEKTVNVNVIESTKKIESESIESKKELDKDEYIRYINPYKMHETSEYVKYFYTGNLSDEAKLYISLYNLDSDKVVLEDELNYIDEDDLKEVYDDLFMDEFVPKSFKFGEASIKYLENKNMFIVKGTINRDTNIVKEITDVEEDDETIKIKTIEGIVYKKKLFNIVDKAEIKKYSNDSLVKYKDRLNIMEYEFDKESGRLINIEALN